MDRGTSPTFPRPRRVRGCRAGRLPARRGVFTFEILGDVNEHLPPLNCAFSNQKFALSKNPQEVVGR
jgi:hypothetical protein